MERTTQVVVRKSIAGVVLASVVAVSVLITSACGERRPCNAPVKSLDAADSTAPVQ